MFCPPQYLYFFHGLKIWKHSKSCPPHFSFDIPSSGQKLLFYVLDWKFENIPSFVLHTFPLIHLAQDRSTKRFFPSPYLCFLPCSHPASGSWFWNLEIFLFPCANIKRLLDCMADTKNVFAKMPRTCFNLANLEAIFKVSMLSSVLSVSPRARLVHTEDDMAFRGNYKFEITAGSTALIFNILFGLKGPAQCLDSSVWPTHTWIV